jgi:hypothetical protein
LPSTWKAAGDSVVDAIGEPLVEGCQPLDKTRQGQST